MKCNHCGLDQKDGAVFCENCGMQLNTQNSQSTQQPFASAPNQGYNPEPAQPNQGQQQGYNQQPYDQQQGYNPQGYNPQGYGQPQGYNPPPPGYNQYAPVSVQTSKYATASLVLGIISLFCGLILAILAIIFGIIGMREQKERGLPTGTAIAGLILGVLGAVGNTIFSVIYYTSIMSQLQLLILSIIS